MNSYEPRANRWVFAFAAFVQLVGVATGVLSFNDLWAALPPTVLLLLCVGVLMGIIPTADSWNKSSEEAPRKSPDGALVGVLLIAFLLLELYILWLPTRHAKPIDLDEFKNLTKRIEQLESAQERLTQRIQNSDLDAQSQLND